MAAADEKLTEDAKPKEMMKMALKRARVARKTIPDWWERIFMCDTVMESYGLAINGLVEAYARGEDVTPAAEDIFSWTTIKPENVRVVIIGQDPYPRKGDAHGLAFSTLAKNTPASLANVFRCLVKKGIMDEFPQGKNCLTKWVKQGILLLNSALTTKVGESNVHKFWWDFTDNVISSLSATTKRKLIFLLWGKEAQKKARFITGYDPQNKETSKHYVMECCHPVVMSFISQCDHFDRTNELLASMGEKPIDWSL